MKNLFKYVLLFAIFCNFFSGNFLARFGLRDGSREVLYKFVSNEYFNETNKELIIIFIVLVLISFFVKFDYGEFNLSKYQGKYKNDSIFLFVTWFFYLLFTFFVFSQINWDFEYAERGMNQFDLKNRPTVFRNMVYGFYVPLLLYMYLVGVFRNKIFYLILALAIFALRGVSSGGRANLITIFILGLLMVNYVRRLNNKTLLITCILGYVALSFSSLDRFSGHNSILINNVVKILQSNSNSDFLAVVKYSIDNGTQMSPQIFGMHIVSVFVPSYIYVNFFNMISYTRGILVYNEMYNTNPNTGLGFMMLADFYWSFKYWGYVLYIFTYYFVLKFFKKYIYSPNPVFVVLALYVVYKFCNQRGDFGEFFKPIVYLFVFLSFLEFLRSRAKVR